MAGKGAQTRERILAQAAPLFNTQGYFGASLNDIMAATGLEKGGIYNHFASKEDLALQAFDFAMARLAQRFQTALEGKRHAVDRLLAVVTVFGELADNSPVVGGCPVLNTAIEADDAHPVLRARAQGAMDDLTEMIRRIVRKGIERGELRADTDPDTLATVCISTAEGAVMMSKLYGDPVHVRRAVDHLTRYINAHVRA